MPLGYLIALSAALALAFAAWPPVASAATCSDYSTQAEAQRAADTRDADGDGVYCETLPCPCLGPGEGDDKPADRSQRISARVRSVTDGDTLKVRAYNAKRRLYDVRLIGIDTPEVYGGVECGGREASRKMRRVALSRSGRGKRVVLRTDPTQDTFDRYGRLLAYVATRSGVSLQKRMLRSGWAKVYVYGGRPFQRVRGFRAAERRAREAGRGVWGRCGGDFHRG